MFMKLTIKSRLTIVIVLLLMSLLAISGMGLLGMSKVKEGLRSVYEDRTVALGRIARVESLILDERLQLSLAILDPSADKIKRQTELVEKHIDEAGEAWAAFTATSTTTEGERLSRKFEADHGTFVTGGLLPVMALLREGKFDEARNLNERNLDQLYGPVRDEVVALSKLQEDEAKAEYERAQSRYTSTRNLSIVLVLASIVISTLIGFVVIRSITGQIGGEPDYAADVVRLVSEGDLSVQVRKSVV